MDYYEVITLRNGKECCLRSANESDGAAVLENFLLTHEETDNLLSYPDENTFSAKKEGELLRKKAESEKEIEIIAVIDGKVAGSAGINAIGRYHKVRHRAEFGISIAKEYWGLGIGGKLTNACIASAKKAGYAQLELDVVANNERAIEMYKRAGFVEFGRNPKGFNSRISGYQELVYMRLEL